MPFLLFSLVTDALADKKSFKKRFGTYLDHFMVFRIARAQKKMELQLMSVFRTFLIVQQEQKRVGKCPLGLVIKVI